MTSGFSRVLIVCLIIVGILGAPIYEAQQVQAQTLTFAGAVKDCLKAAAIEAIIIIAGYVIGFFLNLVPTIDVAQIWQDIKEAIKDPFARCIARAVLDETIGRMLEVVRKKGRDGAASYVRNWRSFETSAQYRGEDTARGIVANTELCDYFKQDMWRQYGLTTQSRVSLRGINIRVDSLLPFTVQGKCPLPRNFDLNAYERDPIANGGWAAYDRMLQPQGNAMGADLLIADELIKQRGTEVRADLNEQTGSGFLGTRGSDVAGSGNGVACMMQRISDEASQGRPLWVPAGCGALQGGTGASQCIQMQCVNRSTNAPTGKACGGIGEETSGCDDTTEDCVGVCTGTGGQANGTNPAGPEPSCLVKGANGKCIRYADIRSPGTYVRDAVAAQVQQELAWITNVDELKELVINYIYMRLTNRLQDLGADEQPPTYNNSEDGFGGNGTIHELPPGPTCTKPPGCFGATQCPGQPCGGGASDHAAYNLRVGHFEWDVTQNVLWNYGTTGSSDCSQYQYFSVPTTVDEWCNGQAGSQRVPYPGRCPTSGPRCIDGSAGVTPPQCAPICTSNPPPPPSGSPTPPPGGGACVLKSAGATASFDSQVNSAINAYIAAHPSQFNGDQVLAGNENAYVQGVAQIISSSGLQATQDPNASDEIEVKRDDTFSDSYDILTSGGLVRRAPGAFTATCSPAAF